VNIHRKRHRSDTTLGEPARPFSDTFKASDAILLRVAAVQLPRIDREDRAALRKYVERDMGR
jgi:hypothetical protein